MRRESDDPVHLSPHERRLEVAAILAAGVHRLRVGAAVTAPVGPGTPIAATETPPESSLSGLEDGAPSRPDGSRRQTEMTREER